MSNELIESLRYLANRPPYSGAADIMLRAADALEAKAAPVGERETAIALMNDAVLNGGWNNVREMGIHMFQAGAAYQRQQAREVVMPTLVVKESGEWGDAYERGFKAALREFARLNGKEVGRG